MWTPPLVTLVICCGSVLVFLTIIFIFVFVETRRATGKVSFYDRLLLSVTNSGTTVLAQICI